MMATYFHGGSEIQGAAAGGGGDHNLQTLYLMNPNFISAYSESQTPPNNNNSMLFLNQAHSNTLPHAPPPPQHHQQFIGIPVAGPHPSEDHARPSPSSSSSQLQQHHHQIPAALHGISVSRAHPNLWSPGPSQQGQISAAASASGPHMADQIGFRRPAAAQGLSLSLSPGMQQNNQNQMSHHHHHHQVTVASTNGVIPGSQYLKAAQELLEEVVNVGSSSSSNGTNHYFINNDKARTRDNNNDNNNNNNGDNRTEESSGAHQDKAKAAVPAARDQSGVSHGGGGGENSENNNTKKAVELSTAQRQELQMKKAKLLNMLEEVEQRYRQYNSQMQVVVSSFEQAAGSGSAKLYTSLALKTISKQFRCLKDAIMSQIKATSKSLGEEDSNNSNVKLEGGSGSRLRFVDHQLRQQRALQQLGMMQHNAWRPQRGLPERAVSVLRAWLFEHFLHPYPKDSDKHMLAKQTGLTRSQVSNWFINARVRLWKPMVEEMYLEEIKTQEQNSGNSEEDTTTVTANKSANNSLKNDPSTAKVQDRGGNRMLQRARQEEETEHTKNDMISNISVMSTTSSQGFSLIGSASDMESLMQRSPKKQRSGGSDMQNSPSSILSMDMEMKPVEQRQSYMMANNSNNPGDGGSSGGFSPYIVSEMGGGRYDPEQMTTAHPAYSGNNNNNNSNNGVSLTLGLPNLSLGNINQHQQNFLQNQSLQLGRESDFCGISMAQPNNNVYESIDIQNRKRFAAQLLHDHFVASQ